MSDSDQDNIADNHSYGAPTVQTEGEFEGWSYWSNDAFEAHNGPFYMRRQEDGSYISAFRAEDRHMNGGGSIHGGCLMTFADFALFAIATDEMQGNYGVTINLSGDFLGGAGPGTLLEARGEITRGGGKTIFVRGLVTGDGAPVLSFTGIIRKLTPKV